MCANSEILVTFWRELYTSREYLEKMIGQEKYGIGQILGGGSDGRTPRNTEAAGALREGSGMES